MQKPHFKKKKPSICFALYLFYPVKKGGGSRTLWVIIKDDYNFSGNIQNRKNNLYRRSAVRNHAKYNINYVHIRQQLHPNNQPPYMQPVGKTNVL